jgi:hypothetical protein
MPTRWAGSGNRCRPGRGVSPGGAGTEFAGGRVEPTGGYGEFVLDHGEERIGVVDDVVLIRQRVFVSDPEICCLAGALADVGQVAVGEGHFFLHEALKQAQHAVSNFPAATNSTPGACM